MRLLQVGLGIMGRHWLQTVLAAPGVEFAGFVEVNSTLALERAREFDLDPALIFTSLEEALDAVVADAALIVTPPGLHEPQSLLALRRGIPVLCEKPLADTLPAAQSIVRAAEETGVLHMVAQNYRYSRQAQTIKRLLGELGTLGSVTVEFFRGPHLFGFHQQLSYPLLLDMSIHHFDMMRFFLGAEPLSVTAQSWSTPWNWFKGDASASAVFEFPGGVMVSYTASWTAPGQVTPWNGNWRFEGADGVLLLRDDRAFLHRRSDEFEIGSGPKQYANFPLQRVRLLPMRRQRQAYLLHEFGRAIRGRATSATTCQDNIKSYRMVWDAIHSAQTGRRVLCATGHGSEPRP